MEWTFLSEAQVFTLHVGGMSWAEGRDRDIRVRRKHSSFWLNKKGTLSNTFEH